MMGPDGIAIRAHLEMRDRAEIAEVLAEAGVFRAEEVAVALELIDESLHPKPDTDYQWRVATDSSGRVVGFACFGPVPMTEGTFDLYWIAVARDVRGRGVAKRLQEEVEDAIRGQGGRWILAETSSTPIYEPARHFYARSGFDRVECIPDFYRPGDDRLTFGKRLDRPGPEPESLI